MKLYFYFSLNKYVYTDINFLENLYTDKKNLILKSALWVTESDVRALSRRMPFSEWYFTPYCKQQKRTCIVIQPGLRYPKQHNSFIVSNVLNILWNHMANGLPSNKFHDIVGKWKATGYERIV